MYRILFLLALIVSAPQVRSQSALDVIAVHVTCLPIFGRTET